MTLYYHNAPLFSFIVDLVRTRVVTCNPVCIGQNHMSGRSSSILFMFCYVLFTGTKLYSYIYSQPKKILNTIMIYLLVFLHISIPLIQPTGGNSKLRLNASMTLQNRGLTTQITKVRTKSRELRLCKVHGLHGDFQQKLMKDLRTRDVCFNQNIVTDSYLICCGNV